MHVVNLLFFLATIAMYIAISRMEIMEFIKLLDLLFYMGIL